MPAQRAPRSPASSIGETGAAGDVEQRVAGAHAEAVVHSDVLPAVGRFAEGGEVHGPPSPALVDAAPALV